MQKTILIRKIIQLAVLALFIFTVLQAAYPFNPLLPPELFLWLDPLAGLAVMISERTIIAWFGLALIVLALTIAFSRSFCGWICPLGTIIDISDNIIGKKTARVPKSLQKLKTIILAILLALAVFQIQLIWFFDPLPLLWRTLGAAIFPALTFVVNWAFDFLLNAGVDYDWMYDAYDAITMHVLPLESVYVRGVWLVGAIFAAILLLGLLSRRFWCRNLCPLGALLGQISRFGLLKREIDDDRCTRCEICVSDCKMGAIDDNFVDTDKTECIMCLNCSDSCQSGAASYRFKKIRKKDALPSPARRDFVVVSSAGVLLLLAGKLFPSSGGNPRLIRPPGARDEDEFLNLCIRCDECIRICSTTGRCLTQSYFDSGWLGFWTPKAEFYDGYCEYNCNLCGEICPTGAIEKSSLKSKQVLKIGKAVIIEDLCVPYKERQICLVCEEHCPTPQKAIYFTEKEFTDENGGLKSVKQPKIDEELCIGCGICVAKCPVEPVRAVEVVTLEMQ